jgi:hypothetical protein
LAAQLRGLRRRLSADLLRLALATGSGGNVAPRRNHPVAAIARTAVDLGRRHRRIGEGLTERLTCCRSTRGGLRGTHCLRPLLHNVVITHYLIVRNSQVKFNIDPEKKIAGL